MQVTPTPTIAAQRRTRRPLVVLAAAPAERAVTPAPARTWRTVTIGPVSRAGGAWTVDWARAHADARRVLEAIDFSKRDIVLWVPGTDARGVHRSFESAVRESWAGLGGASLTALDYEASWALRSSVPTGIATLKLVLEGVRAKLAAMGNPPRTVSVAGESQGAWIAGEVLADPEVGDVVDRAVLIGHPWLASHQYTAGEDPRVRVVNHEGDQVTLPIRGDAAAGVDAMIAIRTLDLGRLPGALATLASNAEHGWLLLKSVLNGVPVVKDLVRNPHDYSHDMTRVVEYLHSGRFDSSTDADAEALRMATLRAQLLRAPVAA